MKNLLDTLPSLSSVIERDLTIVHPEMLAIEVISLMGRSRELQWGSGNANPTPRQPNITTVGSVVAIVERDRLVGIFTDRDLARLIATQIDLQGMAIGAVMTRNPQILVLSPEQNILSAAYIFAQHQISYLLMLDDCQQLIGTISIDTIRQVLEPIDRLEMLRALGSLQLQLVERANELEQTNEEFRSEIVTRVQVENRLRRDSNTLAAKMVATTAASAVLTELVAAMTIDQRSCDISLEVSQQGISDFMQNATIGIHWVDAEGIVVWANPAELEMLGYDREDYIGQPLHDFHVDRPMIQSVLERLLHNQPIKNCESQMRRKDGSICDVAIDANPLFKDGKFIHARCFTRDISEQKQAEAALRQSEQKFRAIFDGAFEYIGLLDPQGIVLEANQTALTAMGAAPSIVGQQFADTQWWTHDPALQLQLKQAIVRAATGEIVRFESYHLLPNGRQIVADFSISPIFDETGKVVMLIPEGRDISDLKAGEYKIREQAAMLNIATDAIIVRDLNSKIQFWNDGAEFIYGWTAIEAIGRNTRILFDLDNEPAAKVAFDTIMSTGVWHGEIHKLTKSGQQVTIESRCSLVYNDANLIDSQIVVARGITTNNPAIKSFFKSCLKCWNTNLRLLGRLVAIESPTHTIQSFVRSGEGTTAAILGQMHLHRCQGFESPPLSKFNYSPPIQANRQPID